MNTNDRRRVADLAPTLEELKQQMANIYTSAAALADQLMGMAVKVYFIDGELREALAEPDAGSGPISDGA